MAAAVPQGKPGKLGLLRDEASCQSFLVDSGSVYSILPHSSSEEVSGPALMMANRTPLRSWGWRQRTIVAQGRQFNWKFLQADVGFLL